MEARVQDPSYLSRLISPEHTALLACPTVFTQPDYICSAQELVQSLRVLLLGFRTLCLGLPSLPAHLISVHSVFETCTDYKCH